MSLDNISVTEIKGIGEKRAQAFARLGVSSLYDLISFFPRRYEDRSVFKQIREIADGETVSIQAVVSDTPKLTRIRRGLELVKFKAVDESASVDITYFNQAYLKNTFVRGEAFNFYGKFSVMGNRVTLTNPAFEKADPEAPVSGRIVPIYSLTSGLNRKAVTEAVRSCLNSHGNLIEDCIPENISRKYRLMDVKNAYRQIHFPADYQTLYQARRRMIFEELFVFSCSVALSERDNAHKDGIVVDCSPDAFLETLPFRPTGAQSRAIDQCREDMRSGKAMTRLVQGDVGSGKTLVAAACAYMVSRASCCSAFMAPTEILAEQHYTTLSGMLSPLGLRVEKLTGSVSVKERRRILSALKDGEIDLLVGTHALFSSDVEYSNLGLVITDEQHRFGVGQRSSLISKGASPHVLVMSATPIPRTLALILYGDLDVSVIDELPPGRQKIDTFAVDSSYRARLNGFILKQKQEGRQIFVVCPKVENDGDDEDADGPKIKSAVEHTEALRASLPGVSVECVHGRMKSEEKDRIMNRFAAGEIDVLVATTVVEVGVDVPNASLMIVEDADRFGLSQLHQLRGRVGRGTHKSWCILVSDSDSETARERLKVLCSTNDGFKIAEEDLKIRGPGDFFGVRQHGLPELHLADMRDDMETLQSAHEEALQLLQRDPKLDAPEHASLQKRVYRFYSESSNSFN